jgi:hypothetical protein
MKTVVEQESDASACMRKHQAFALAPVPRWASWMIAGRAASIAMRRDISE